MLSVDLKLLIDTCGLCDTVTYTVSDFLHAWLWRQTTKTTSGCTTFKEERNQLTLLFVSFYEHVSHDCLWEGVDACFVSIINKKEKKTDIIIPCLLCLQEPFKDSRKCAIKVIWSEMGQQIHQKCTFSYSSAISSWFSHKFWVTWLVL